MSNSHLICCWSILKQQRKPFFQNQLPESLQTYKFILPPCLLHFAHVRRSCYGEYADKPTSISAISQYDKLLLWGGIVHRPVKEEPSNNQACMGRIKNGYTIFLQNYLPTQLNKWKIVTENVRSIQHESWGWRDCRKVFDILKFYGSLSSSC